MQGKNNDLLLWSSFLSGDDQAYERIYTEHIQNLFSYGMTFTTDREMVKDCIQDLFIRLYQNRNALGKTDNIRLYLLTGLKNAILNAFSKQDTYQRFVRSYETDDTDCSVEDELMNRENETIQREKVSGIKALLTHRQQEIIHYYYVEGMSIDEIARSLDINYQSVANIIQRALKKIRNSYLEK